MRVGEIIEPGSGRPSHDGCPFCAARDAQMQGENVPNIDPLPRHPEQVYATPNRLYAKHYASLWGRGWLYRVSPVGDVHRSDEDTIETYRANGWRIESIIDRAVLLTWSERRRLFRQWSAADRTETR